MAFADSPPPVPRSSHEDLRTGGAADPLRAEVQLRLLVEIDDATRRLVDAQTITNHAARMLGRHLRVNRCAYAHVEDDQDTFNLTGDYNDGVDSIVGRYQFHDFGEKCRRSIRADEAFIVEDADADPRCADALDAFHATRIRAVICVPLHKSGRLVAAMAVHSATARSWRRDEVDLVLAVASRCWESIERARVTRSLGESVARYRAVIQSMPAAVYTCALDGSIDLYNDAAAALWGGHPTPGSTRWCGSHRLWTTDGTEIPHERCPMAAALLGHVPQGRHEVILERADGTRCHVLPHVQPIRDAQGVVLGAINVLIDITELRRAEVAVRDREARFRRLADAMPQLVWIANDAGEVLYYNSQAERYAPLETTAGSGTWKWHPLVHPDDLRRTSEAWAAAAAARSTYQCEHRIRMRDGAYRWHLSRAYFVVSAAESQWFGTATDVHEIKEADLARSRLAAVVESSEDAIITKDLSGHITSWNRGAQNIFGYTSEEAIGRHITMLMPPDRVAEEQSIISRIRRGETVSHYETVRRRKDGALLTISLSVSPMFDADGRVVGASKIARDITARRVAEQRLRDSEERFRTMADNISQFAWMADESGWIFWYNRRWYDYTGTTLEQMQGWGWTAVHHPDHVERVIECGAWGYASKNDGESSLLEVLRRVVAGEFAMSPEVRSTWSA